MAYQRTFMLPTTVHLPCDIDHPTLPPLTDTPVPGGCHPLAAQGLPGGGNDYAQVFLSPPRGDLGPTPCNERPSSAPLPADQSFGFETLASWFASAARWIDESPSDREAAHYQDEKMQALSQQVDMRQAAETEQARLQATLLGAGTTAAAEWMGSAMRDDGHPLLGALLQEGGGVVGESLKLGVSAWNGYRQLSTDISQAAYFGPPHIKHKVLTRLDNAWSGMEQGAGGWLDGLEEKALTWHQEGLATNTRRAEAAVLAVEQMGALKGDMVKGGADKLAGWLSDADNQPTDVTSSLGQHGLAALLRGVGDLSAGASRLVGEFDANTIRAMAEFENQRSGIDKALLADGVWGTVRGLGGLAENTLETILNRYGGDENVRSVLSGVLKAGSFAMTLADGFMQDEPIPEHDLIESQRVTSALPGVAEALTGNDFSEGRYAEGVTELILKLVNPFSLAKLNAKYGGLPDTIGTVTSFVEDGVEGYNVLAAEPPSSKSPCVE